MGSVFDIVDVPCSWLRIANFGTIVQALRIMLTVGLTRDIQNMSDEIRCKDLANCLLAYIP